MEKKQRHEFAGCTSPSSGKLTPSQKAAMNPTFEVEAREPKGSHVQGREGQVDHPLKSVVTFCGNCRLGNNS